MTDLTTPLITTTQQAHINLVRDLSKPGEDILASLTPAKCELWHHATGIAGEAGELLENAIGAQGLGNYIEELGDLYFYITGYKAAAGIEVTYCNIEGLDSWIDNLLGGATDLAVLSANLLDATKKHLIYESPLDLPEVRNTLAAIEYTIYTIAVSLLTTLDEILAYNIEKLSAKRYPQGYSNQAAADRADKLSINQPATQPEQLSLPLESTDE